MKALFIQHRTPYDGYSAQETLDALLVVAAFGQNPSVLFQGDGVWQLVAAQQPQDMGRSSLVAQLTALDLYDVQDIYVDRQSLLSRGLSIEQLAITVQLIEAENMADFIAHHQPLIRF